MAACKSETYYSRKERRKFEVFSRPPYPPPLFSHGINATHHNLAELNHTRHTCTNNNQSKNHNSDITSGSKSRIVAKITSTLFLKVKYFYCCLILTSRACQQISIVNVEYNSGESSREIQPHSFVNVSESQETKEFSTIASTNISSSLFQIYLEISTGFYFSFCSLVSHVTPSTIKHASHCSPKLIFTIMGGFWEIIIKK